MMKKAISLFLPLLLLLSLAPAAFAAPDTLEADSAYLDPVSKSIAFRVEYGDYYQLMDAKGKVVVTEEAGYTDLDPWDGFFKAELSPENGRARYGLLGPDGTVIVPVQYDEVEVLSERWLSGAVYGPGTEDDWDVSFTNMSTDEETFYKIDSVDYYFDGELVGTLEGSLCRGSSEAFGAYLACYGDNGATFYNSKLEPSLYNSTPYLSMDEYDTDYVGGETVYIHQGSGQTAFQPECTLKAEDLVRPYLYQEGKLYDLQGKEIATFEREYDDFTYYNDGYGLVMLDGKVGLVTVDGKEIIPPEYDNLGNYDDRILDSGYICAEKDGKFGFLNAKGEVVCDLLYPTEDALVYGNFAYYENEDGSYTVVTAQGGELPEHYKYVDCVSYYDNAVFYAEKEDGSSGIVDMKGKALLPFSKKYYGIDLSLDGTVALVDVGDGYAIYHF